MRARSELAMALQEWVKSEGLTQSAAARLFGVTQPPVSDFVRGRLHLFSMDTHDRHGIGCRVGPACRHQKPRAKREQGNLLPHKRLLRLPEVDPRGRKPGTLTRLAWLMIGVREIYSLIKIALQT